MKFDPDISLCFNENERIFKIYNKNTTSNEIYLKKKTIFFFVLIKIL